MRFNVSKHIHDGKETKWNELLRKYKYLQTDELDLVVLEAVKVGYFNKNALYIEADKQAEYTKAFELRNSFMDAWTTYRNSFKDNVEIVCNSIYDGFSLSCSVLTPGEVDPPVTLFRKIGKNTEADAMVDLYITARKKELEGFDMRSPLVAQIEDKYLINALNQLSNKPIENPSLSTALHNLAKQNVWHQEDINVVKSSSESEIFDFLNQYEGANLQKFIRYCLQYNKDRTMVALSRISELNVLNKLRINSLGISLSENGICAD